jgi:hypothetical protein
VWVMTKQFPTLSITYLFENAGHAQNNIMDFFSTSNNMTEETSSFSPMSDMPVAAQTTCHGVEIR